MIILYQNSQENPPKRSNLVLRQHIESFDDYIEAFDWKKFHNTISRFSLNGLGLSTTLFDIWGIVNHDGKLKKNS